MCDMTRCDRCRGVYVFESVRDLWDIVSTKRKHVGELMYPEQKQSIACSGATHLDSAPGRLCVEVLRNHAGQDCEEEARKCAGDNEKIRGHQASNSILCKRWKWIGVEEASRRRERRCATEHLADKRMRASDVTRARLLGTIVSSSSRSSRPEKIRRKRSKNASTGKTEENQKSSSSNHSPYLKGPLALCRK